jgi:SET domain-containing protein
MNEEKMITEELGMLTEKDLNSLVDNAPKCEPGTSALNGYGLFAKERISIGETIVDFSNPELYVMRRIENLEEWRIKAGKFTAIDDETCLVSNKFTKYSLLNHSRTPNALIDVAGRRIYAARDITPGEEVTVDYRTEPMPPRVRKYYDSWL